MYGLPAATDLSALNGLILLQVCVGQNEVILRFDDTSWIRVESAMRLVPDGATPIQEQDGVLRELFAALGAPIEAVQWTVEGTVRIRFQGRDAHVEIVDDDPHYESFMIQLKDQPAIVV
ncbi:DUF6188 family protein [Actinotalea sp. JY-7885]|uniref:DUF6188 family protein n=1 Tax=Actinotalea sp. JY-7885 TaxID=2758576 RepID=UPI00165DF73B|nr:DUF6188 family protein [Actinotalea sp. JY-7885]